MERGDHKPTHEEIAVLAVQLATSFAPQNVSNRSWGFVVLVPESCFVCASILADGVFKMEFCNPQAIANLGWLLPRAFNHHHEPVSHVLSLAEIANGNAPGTGGAHGYAVAWSFWRIATPGMWTKMMWVVDES